ncbi:lasso RiPP family leader peptide-containing protein [Saccharopolyspora sp. K220]|nr:lasso RiPP family leader peptide-containing protein [Saccharopolyspora soli]MCI2423723.1 lasso RiPP family leader peptide-containing protein [Saccharopolyspora soli]
MTNYETPQVVELGSFDEKTCAGPPAQAQEILWPIVDATYPLG